MTTFRPHLTGREARRAKQFGTRRKGAGWTRAFRKGRTQRYPYQAPTQHKETPE